MVFRYQVPDQKIPLATRVSSIFKMAAMVFKMASSCNVLLTTYVIIYYILFLFRFCCLNMCQHDVSFTKSIIIFVLEPKDLALPHEILG